MTEGRLEFKHCVTDEVAARVLDIARHHLEAEPLADGPRQRITSLYLDTPDLRFLRWHHERASDRFKLRIRRYGEPPVRALYSEIKRKTCSVVRKQRSLFDVAQLDEVIARYRKASSAEPCVLITGIRESLRAPGSEDAVTVDRLLHYQPMRVCDLVGDGNSWRVLPLPDPKSSALLEIKSGHEPPSWMQLLLDALAASRISFSKYAAAMSAGHAARGNAV